MVANISNTKHSKSQYEKIANPGYVMSHVSYFVRSSPKIFPSPKIKEVKCLIVNKIGTKKKGLGGVS